MSIRFRLATILFCLAPCCALANPLGDSYDTLTLPTSPEFMVDYYYDKTGLPQGSLVLLHGNENQFLANNLGVVLSKHGWSVANVNMSLQESGTASNASKVPAPLPGDILLALLLHLREEKGQFNIVLLALEDTWTPLNNFMVSQPNELSNIRGLVLLDVIQRAELQHLPALVPMLDIDTHPVAAANFQLRKVQSQRYRLEHYQQLHLPMAHQPIDYSEDRLVRRIRGWLAKHVRGMEVRKQEYTR